MAFRSAHATLYLVGYACQMQHCRPDRRMHAALIPVRMQQTLEPMTGREAESARDPTAKRGGGETWGRNLTVQLARVKGLPVASRIMKPSTGRWISRSYNGTGSWMRCMSMPSFSSRLQRCGKSTAPDTKRSVPCSSSCIRHRSSCTHGGACEFGWKISRRLLVVEQAVLHERRHVCGCTYSKVTVQQSDLLSADLYGMCTADVACCWSKQGRALPLESGKQWSRATANPGVLVAD